jgi:hypothetical protein
VLVVGRDVDDALDVSFLLEHLAYADMSRMPAPARLVFA